MSQPAIHIHALRTTDIMTCIGCQSNSESFKKLHHYPTVCSVTGNQTVCWKCYKSINQLVHCSRSSCSSLLVVSGGVKTALASTAFRVAAPKIWNALPASSFLAFNQRHKFCLFNIVF
jgi:hypothetical protein